MVKHLLSMHEFLGSIPSSLPPRIHTGKNRKKALNNGNSLKITLKRDSGAATDALPAAPTMVSRDCGHGKPSNAGGREGHSVLKTSVKLVRKLGFVRGKKLSESRNTKMSVKLTFTVGIFDDKPALAFLVLVFFFFLNMFAFLRVLGGPGWP